MRWAINTIAIAIAASVILAAGADEPAAEHADFVVERHRAGALVAFIYRWDRGSETYFYGGMNAEHPDSQRRDATMVFLGSVRAGDLLTGVLSPSSSLPDTLWNLWTDGRCEFLGSPFHDSQDVYELNVAQLVEAMPGEVMIGLARLGSLTPADPVLEANLLPLFGDLVPKDLQQEPARAELSQSVALLRLLWDRLAVRFESAITELDGLDRTILDFPGLAPSRGEPSTSDAPDDGS
jgi:hypothetical protein